MRAVLIAAAFALLLLPWPALAQSRPAPDVPGELDILDVTPPTPSSRVSAMQVVMVTSGLIGGFIAADIISGGILTAPLLRSAALAAETAAGVRTVQRAAAVSPALAPAAPSLARALTRWGSTR